MQIITRDQCPENRKWDRAIEEVFPDAERERRHANVEACSAVLENIPLGSAALLDDQAIQTLAQRVHVADADLKALQEHEALVWSCDPQNPLVHALQERNRLLSERLQRAKAHAIRVLSTADVSKLAPLLEALKLAPDTSTILTQATAALAVAMELQGRILLTSQTVSAKLQGRQADEANNLILRRLYAQYQQPFVDALQQMAALRVGEARASGLSFRRYLAEQNGVPVALFSNWSEVVRQQLPLFRRFLAWNRRFFGPEQIPFTHLIQEPGARGQPITLEQTLAQVMLACAPLGPDYVAAIAELRDNGRIDHCQSQGRRPGNARKWLLGKAFIFLNYSSSSYAARRVVAHEVGGHGAQSILRAR